MPDCQVTIYEGEYIWLELFGQISNTETGWSFVSDDGQLTISVTKEDLQDTEYLLLETQ